MARIPPPPPKLPKTIRVRCHCGETLLHAPRVREPEFLYARRVSASSRPVTGISGENIYQPLDGQVTIDVWDENAIGWDVRCPRPGCGTERRFDAYALRQLVAGAGAKLFITLGKPLAPKK